MKKEEGNDMKSPREGRRRDCTPSRYFAFALVSILRIPFFRVAGLLLSPLAFFLGSTSRCPVNVVSFTVLLT